ncbi:MAG: hypothetical protein AB2L13_15385 [Spirochaetota bacterium]
MKATIRIVAPQTGIVALMREHVKERMEAHGSERKRVKATIRIVAPHAGIVAHSRTHVERVG